MITFAIALAVGAGVGLALGLSDTCGYGWSTFFGVLAFGVTQGVGGFLVQRKVKAAMARIQAILQSGQKQMQAKIARWQMRPPGSLQAAQAEMARDQKTFVMEALAATETLHRFDLWVPMMKRQIATAQFQLCWILKDFDKVDELLPKAFVAGPEMTAMKLARMQMRGEPVEAIRKVYDKSAKRARYNGNVLADACFSWILVKRGLVDDAFKVLTAALKKSDNQFLKANHEHLMNNRVTHFTNSGFGEQWYSLFLEEPKIKAQKQRPVYR